MDDELWVIYLHKYLRSVFCCISFSSWMLYVVWAIKVFEWMLGLVRLSWLLELWFFAHILIQELRDGCPLELFFSASHCCCSIPQSNFLINFRILSAQGVILTPWSAKHLSHHYNEYNIPSINIPSISSSILFDHYNSCVLFYMASPKITVWCASLRCTNIKRYRLISSISYILLCYRLLTFRCCC